MRVFILAFIAALLLQLPPAQAAEAVDLELVLAADGSGSIDEDELRTQRDGYARAVTSPEVLSAIKSGILGRIALIYTEWGGPQSQHTIVDWQVIEDQASAEAFAERLRRAPRKAVGYNSISGAIDYGASLIRSNAYEGTRKVIDVSGDGPQMGGPPLAIARAEALAAEITINALVIRRPGGGYPGPGGMPLVDHYERDVIGGRGAFVTTVEGLADFAKAVRNKMILEIAEGSSTGVVAGLGRR